MVDDDADDDGAAAAAAMLVGCGGRVVVVIGTLRKSGCGHWAHLGGLVTRMRSEAPELRRFSPDLGLVNAQEENVSQIRHLRMQQLR